MINKSVKPATCKDIAKSVVINNLSKSISEWDFNIEALCAIRDIEEGNDELLYSHIEALRNIFDMALKEMEKDNPELLKIKGEEDER